MPRALAPLVLVAVALLCLVAPVGAANLRSAALIGPGDIYLALGDSLSTGDEHPDNSAAEGNKPGYPVAIANQLRATRTISYTNLAVSGETSSSMLAAGGQLAAAEAYIAAQRAAGKRVGLVTLSIGGNDMVAALRGQATVTTTLALFRPNLEQILTRLVAATTVGGQRTADLLIMNYYNPYPGVTIRDIPGFVDLPDGQEPIVTDRDVPKFNQIIGEEAAERGITLVNVFAAFQGKEQAYIFANLTVFPLSEASLDYHPREAGHQAIAFGFLDAGGYLPRLYLPVLTR